MTRSKAIAWVQVLVWMGVIAYLPQQDAVLDGVGAAVGIVLRVATGSTRTMARP